MSDGSSKGSCQGTSCGGLNVGIGEVLAMATATFLKRDLMEFVRALVMASVRVQCDKEFERLFQFCFEGCCVGSAVGTCNGYCNVPARDPCLRCFSLMTDSDGSWDDSCDGLEAEICDVFLTGRQ